MADLDGIFRARSIAVVGASADPTKRGHVILRNILAAGFGGAVYPVNPRGGEILGLPVFPGLGEIPGPVDLVVIVVPAPAVPGTIDECGRKGVRGAIVISGGFREAGNEDLELELVNAARRAGVAVVGPNCQGVQYTPNRLCASWPVIKARGSLAVISQSGTVAAAFCQWAEADGLGISAAVSLGNRCDVDESDLVEFLSTDSDTASVGLYLEGVRRGDRFMETMSRATRQRSIVVLKGGRTSQGRRAAESHTKSVAGSTQVFDAACRKAGLHRAETLIELYDFTKALALTTKPRGNRLLIVTSSGGSAILATDAAQRSGLEVSPLPGETLATLRDGLPSHCVIGNPLDLTGDTDAERYHRAVTLAARHDPADMVLLIFGDPIPGAAEVSARLARETGMPLAACYLGGGEDEAPESVALNRAGIPVYPTPERAARALAAAAGLTWARGET